MSRVDMIIPTLNGSHLLRRCLRSLRRSTMTAFDLIVFDDGSSEDIATLVAAEWPSARLIRSERNVGLARAFNRAIAAGMNENVVLLNNDTEVEPDWLEEIVACADRHPRAGSIASKIRLASDRRRLHSAADYYSARGMPGNRGVWLEDFGQYDREAPVFAACGAAALYRRRALDALQRRDGYIFDERLFMYCEDVDLAWRLHGLGLPCVFAPRAVVYHALSATAGGPLASYYVSRNIWLMLARSVPSGVMRPYYRRIAAFHVGRIVRTLPHLREPAARASLRGTFAGLIELLSSHREAAPISEEERRRLRRLLVGG